MYSYVLYVIFTDAKWTWRFPEIGATVPVWTPSISHGFSSQMDWIWVCSASAWGSKQMDRYDRFKAISTKNAATIDWSRRNPSVNGYELKTMQHLDLVSAMSSSDHQSSSAPCLAHLPTARLFIPLQDWMGARSAIHIWYLSSNRPSVSQNTGFETQTSGSLYEPLCWGRLGSEILPCNHIIR